MGNSTVIIVVIIVVVIVVVIVMVIVVIVLFDGGSEPLKTALFSVGLAEFGCVEVEGELRESARLNVATILDVGVHLTQQVVVGQLTKSNMGLSVVGEEEVLVLSVGIHPHLVVS